MTTVAYLNIIQIVQRIISIGHSQWRLAIKHVWWAKDLIAKLGGNVVRWTMISSHYRAPLNLNENAFETAQKELTKIQNAYSQACVQMQINKMEFTNQVESKMWNAFIDAMNDDLNTPNAVSVVFETVKQINQAIRKRPLDVALPALIVSLEKMMYVLGICLDKKVMSEEDIQNYISWKAAVKAKDFETADVLRAQLQEKGIL